MLVSGTAMQKRLLDRLISRVAACGLGLSALCVFEVLAIALPAQAQSRPHSLADSSAVIHSAIIRSIVDSQLEPTRTITDELLPLSARTIESPGVNVGLDQVSAALNLQIERDLQTDTETGLKLNSLPIIGELVDEAGNLDMGIRLPFDMTIGDVMGETGLVFSADFTVD